MPAPPRVGRQQAWWRGAFSTEDKVSVSRSLYLHCNKTNLRPSAYQQIFLLQRRGIMLRWFRISFELRPEQENPDTRLLRPGFSILGLWPISRKQMGREEIAMMAKIAGKQKPFHRGGAETRKKQGERRDQVNTEPTGRTMPKTRRDTRSGLRGRARWGRGGVTRGNAIDKPGMGVGWHGVRVGWNGVECQVGEGDTKIARIAKHCRNFKNLTTDEHGSHGSDKTVEAQIEFCNHNTRSLTPTHALVKARVRWRGSGWRSLIFQTAPLSKTVSRARKRKARMRWRNTRL